MSPAGWVLRVASCPEVGAGHVLRCLALARVLAVQAETRFVLDPQGLHWLPRLRDAGFDAVADDGSDSGPTLAGVVVDVYDPPASLMARWRRRAGRLAQLVDGGPAAPEADLAVRQWCEPEEAESGRDLAGLDYVLIDPAYGAVAAAPVPAMAERVLVSFGYRDSPNATGRVLASLERLRRVGWSPRVTVVMGGGAPHLALVSDATARLGGRLLIDVPGLAQLTAECDLAIGAGGVSAAERAAAGRPSATLTIAEHQRPVAEMLARRGATLDLGRLSDVDDPVLDRLLLDLAGDAGRRAAMAEVGRRVVDGRGAERVAAALLALPELPR